VRRIGELVDDLRKVGKRAKVGRPKKNGGINPPILTDQSIDKNLADRARKAAATPEEGQPAKPPRSGNLPAREKGALALHVRAPRYLIVIPRRDLA